MADRRNTELAQILNRQPAQNLPINVVVTEHGLISLEPKAAEPFGHFHMSRLETASLANHYNSRRGILSRLRERRSHARSARA